MENKCISIPVSGIVAQWKCDVGEEITEGQYIADIVVLPNKDIKRLNSPLEGKVTNKIVDNNGKFNSGEDLLELEYCPHAEIISDMCVLCGKDLSRLTSPASKKPTGANRVKLAHIGMSLSAEAAMEREVRTMKRLQAEKKLSLVLDLDHTLLHATSGNIEAIFDKDVQDSKIITDIHRFKIPKDRTQHYVKMRPFLHKFLEDVSKLFELHVYTHGTRPYAQKMVDLIDPTHKYFQSRILSRTECTLASQGAKSLAHMFPVDDAMVVIIDDRFDVWRGCKNLIRIEPYHFFLSGNQFESFHIPKINNTVNEKNGAQQQTEMQVKNLPCRSAALQDSQLIWALHILQGLHQRYFSCLARKCAQSILHTRFLLYKMRSNSLSGVHLIFSGVIPLQAEPEDSMYWKISEAYGAYAYKDVNNRVTHVVACRHGTAKVIEAEQLAQKNSKPLKVVRLEWLIDCFKFWEHVDETTYLLSSSSPPSSVDQFKSLITGIYYGNVKDVEEFLDDDQAEELYKQDDEIEGNNSNANTNKQDNSSNGDNSGSDSDDSSGSSGSDSDDDDSSSSGASSSSDEADDDDGDDDDDDDSSSSSSASSDGENPAKRQKRNGEYEQMASWLESELF